MTRTSIIGTGAVLAGAILLAGGLAAKNTQDDVVKSVEEAQMLSKQENGAFSQVKDTTDSKSGITYTVDVYDGPKGKGYVATYRRRVGTTSSSTPIYETKSVCYGNECEGKVWDWR